MIEGESDRDIRNWDKRLADQVQYGWDNYKHLNINLSTARLDQPFRIAGEFIYIEDSSSPAAKAKIKLNRSNNSALDLKKGVKIETIFLEIFITNDAIQDEWLDLVFGINFDYYNQDKISDAEAQPCIILTNVLADTNTIAAANFCKRVLIRAFTGNAGTVWINFGAAAVAGACYELTAGDAISVPCSNTNRINGLFTAGGDDATIVF